MNRGGLLPATIHTSFPSVCWAYSTPVSRSSSHPTRSLELSRGCSAPSTPPLTAQRGQNRKAPRRSLRQSIPTLQLSISTRPAALASPSKYARHWRSSKPRLAFWNRFGVMRSATPQSSPQHRIIISMDCSFVCFGRFPPGALLILSAASTLTRSQSDYCY